VREGKTGKKWKIEKEAVNYLVVRRGRNRKREKSERFATLLLVSSKWFAVCISHR